MLVHKLITGTHYVELAYPAGHHSVAELQMEPTGCHDVYHDGSINPGFQYYDISPDGQRFLMIKAGEVGTPIHVVLNWFEES